VCISAGIISNGKQEFIQCTTEWLMTVSTVLVRETTKKKVTGVYMKHTVIKTAQLIYQFYCSRFLVSKTKAGKRSVI